MAYAPIQLLSTPLEDYAGYWLKFYTQGTTTPLSMATDSTGGTLIIKAEISSGGDVPIGFIKTSGDALLNPHLNAAYDAWLFATAAEADANDTTLAIQLADNINSDPTASLTIPGYTETDKAAAVLVTPVAGKTMFVESSDGGLFKAITGAAPGTYADNGGAYCGTQFIPTGGDGSTAWVRVDGGYNVGLGYSPIWFGAVDGADSTAAYKLIMALGVKVDVNGGTYTISDSVPLVTNTNVTCSDDVEFIYSGTMTTDNIFTATSQTNISWIGGKFTGDITADASSTEYGAAFNFVTCSNIKVEGTIINGFPRSGIKLRDTTDYDINHNEIYNIKSLSDVGGVSGVNIEDESNDGDISYNKVHDIGDGASSFGGSGMRLIVQTGGKNIAKNVDIHKNHVNTIAEHGILFYDGSAGTSSEASLVFKNTIKDTGLRAGGSRGNGIYLLQVSGVSIEGNTLRRTNTNTVVASILHAAIACTPNALTTDKISIIGNTIDTDPLAGIRVQGATSLVVEGNNISTAGESIWVTKIDNFSVCSNVCIGTGADYGIVINANSGVNSIAAVNGNTVSSVTIGLILTSITDGAVNGNTVNGYSLQGIFQTTCTNTGGTGNVIKSATDVPAIQTSGVNVNCRWSKNIIQPRATYTEPYIVNAGTGVIIEIDGTIIPTQGTYAVGDKITYNVPTAAAADYARCVTAGTPGTWKAGAALAA